MLSDFPFFLLAWSLFKPYSLPNRISIDIDNELIAIRAQPLNLGSVFSRLGRELSQLVGDKKLIKEVVTSVFYGRNLFYLMRDFLRILSPEPT